MTEQPKPRKHPQLWQAYKFWDEMTQLKIRHSNRLAAHERGACDLDPQVEWNILNHVGALVDGKEEQVSIGILQLHAIAEKHMQKAGKAAGPIWDDLLTIKGVGENLAAKLIAEIDDISLASTVSKLWRFAGYGLGEYWIDEGGAVKAPREGWRWIKKGDAKIRERAVAEAKPGWHLERVRDRMVSGWASCYNKALKSIVWQIGDQFIRQYSVGYEDYYRAQKEQELMRHGDEMSAGRLDKRARRKTQKLFLQHLWLRWRHYEGLPLSRPYVHDRLGHGSLITPEECGWSALGTARIVALQGP